MTARMQILQTAHHMQIQINIVAVRAKKSYQAIVLEVQGEAVQIMQKGRVVAQIKNVMEVGVV